MSQQSTLKMMLPFYERWMRSFPTLDSLAVASEEKVLKHWEGLGYYSRARNIHKAAKTLINVFPKEPTALLEIPGIGPYTAAAVASIAFDFPAIPIDGNVTRVFSRYFALSNPFGSKEDAKKIHELAQELAQYSQLGQRGNLSQALMELGALVCKPNTQARCFECPLQKTCKAKALGRVEQWPLPKKRAEMQKVARLLLLYRNSKGELLLRQRPDKLPLAGQWEIPYLDLEASGDEVVGLFSSHFELKKAFKHTIMNKSYSVWPLELGRASAEDMPGYRYFSSTFTGVLSTITRKFLSNSSKKSID
jgi:A/G-specific adenine glycosylase